MESARHRSSTRATVKAGDEAAEAVRQAAGNNPCRPASDSQLLVEPLEMSDVASLVEPHIPALRRYAWALLRDDQAADDLVQDCLERAVRRWHLRRRDGNVRAWLFAILH